MTLKLKLSPVSTEVLVGDNVKVAEPAASAVEGLTPAMDIASPRKRTAIFFIRKVGAVKCKWNDVGASKKFDEIITFRHHLHKEAPVYKVRFIYSKKYTDTANDS